MDAVLGKKEEDGTGIPDSLMHRLERGRRAMLKDAQQVKLNIYFWRGDQFYYLNPDGVLSSLPTASNPFGANGGKPRHRMRQSFNFVSQLVEGKVSAATQKIPSYEINPSTTEPDDQDAARLAEKVALFGYDKWNLRRMSTELVTNALVQREGFAYPFWNSDVGPYTQNADGEWSGRGEIEVPVLGATEVYWEPGTSFADSPYHAIERAMYAGDVMDMDGFDGLPITPDAVISDNPVKRDGEKMVMVTEYLERPSKKHPQGRRIVMANKRIILTTIEDYPYTDADGKAIDEPCLIPLSYIVDPTQDRDRSLVTTLVDPQRTINDCWNKLIEWKNRALNPQMVAPIGSLLSPPDDVPGAIREYRPTGMNPPTWETPPRIPPELMSMLDNAITQMRILASDVDVQADPNLAARTAQAAIEQATARWQSFMGDYAQAHSRIMRRCLYLVQRYYDEPRLLTIEGMFGPDLIPGFKGADLCGQADVRVNPGSLDAISRTQLIQETMSYAQLGWISGHEAMAAISGGIADNLYKSWELDVGRANRVMQAIQQNAHNFLALYPDQQRDVPVLDPVTQQPAIDLMGKPVTKSIQVPWFMPRPGVDNTAVHKSVITAWMKTTGWDRMDPVQREYGQMYLDALLSMEADEQAKQMQAQQAEAAQLGMGNASKPSISSPIPAQVPMDGPPITQSSVLNL